MSVVAAHPPSATGTDACNEREVGSVNAGNREERRAVCAARIERMASWESILEQICVNYGVNNRNLLIARSVLRLEGVGLPRCSQEVESTVRL